MKSISHYFIITMIITGCSNDVQKEQIKQTGLTYAEKFEIHDDTLIVKEPWPGAQKPKTYLFEKVPERIVVTSTTHLPYLEMLGHGDKLVGFPGMKYVSSEYFRSRYEKGEITDVGSNGNINIELIYSLQPDVVIAFDMGSESSILDKLEEAGITVVYNADFLETSALGRTEWIKFFGVLLQEKEKSDSIFSAISNNYKLLQNKTSNVKSRPTVFSGVMYGDVWFMPGGDNWSAEFFDDAGGNYLWSENEQEGWLEISFESVYDKAHQADFWIGTSTFNSLGALESQDERYSEFSAFKNNNVYNYSKRTNPNGGYDFFESGYSRPDIVLRDLINILHPDLLRNNEFYYFEKLQ